jgi:predicted amidophosphoribosyltransferase
MAVCQACAQNATSVQAACGVSYHLGCLVGYSSRHGICPNCDSSMELEQYQLVCKDCGQKLKKVTFEDIRAMYSKEGEVEGVKCPYC